MGWGEYNRLFTDILSYLRIPPILLYSHLVLCPDYVRLFLMLSGNYSSNEINFFLRILVERNFCFHMGISHLFQFLLGISHLFQFLLGISHLSLLGISHLFSYLWLFPFYSLIFGYFPFVIGYSALDLSS